MITRIILSEEYKELPNFTYNGNVGLNTDGEPLRLYEQCLLVDGSDGIVRYFIEDGEMYYLVSEYIEENEY